MECTLPFRKAPPAYHPTRLGWTRLVGRGGGQGGCDKCNDIPPSVSSIGQSAFRGCSALRSVAIPKSVTSIEAKVCWGCRRPVSGLSTADGLIQGAFSTRGMSQRNAGRWTVPVCSVACVLHTYFIKLALLGARLQGCAMCVLYDDAAQQARNVRGKFWAGPSDHTSSAWPTTAPTGTRHPSWRSSQPRRKTACTQAKHSVWRSTASAASAMVAGSSTVPTLCAIVAKPSSTAAQTESEAEQGKEQSHESTRALQDDSVRVHNSLIKYNY